jgi:hypothetical protein
MNSEILLCGLTVIDEIGAHRYCIDRHCLAKGNTGKGACLTDKIAKHLSNQTSGYNKFKDRVPNNTTDWMLLDNALKSPEKEPNKQILTHFSMRNKSYGLRYSYHRDLGKSFVMQLLNSHHTFLKWDETLWGKALSIKQLSFYQKLFLSLCDDCERHSCGGIYR